MRSYKGEQRTNRSGHSYNMGLVEVEAAAAYDLRRTAALRSRGRLIADGWIKSVSSSKNLVNLGFLRSTPMRYCPIFLATSSLFKPLFPTEFRTEKTAFVRVVASKHASRSRRNCSFTSSTLSPFGGMLIHRRQQVAHSDRAQCTILQPIGVPLLRGLHVAMAKKITHFEDCCAHVEQSRARITTK